jgi:hypothetical protein
MTLSYCSHTSYFLSFWIYLSLSWLETLFPPFSQSDHLFLNILFAACSLLCLGNSPRFHFLVSAVTPSCVLTSEDLELGALDEREHVMFAFLGLCYLTQYDLSLFHPFTCEVHDFIFLYSWIAFPSVYASHFIIHSSIEGCWLPFFNYCG